MTTPTLPRLLAISDRRSLPVLDGWLDLLLAAAPLALQLREKDLDDRALYQLAVAVRERLGEEVPLVINGRADVALAAGAAGVHLPADGVPVAALRRRFGSRLWLGCSTHHPAEAARAGREGADYVTFGPIFPTPSKAAWGPPAGLDALRQAVDGGVPVFALGGVTAENLPAVAAAGAYGVAAIRACQDPAALDALAGGVARCWPRHA